VAGFCEGNIRFTDITQTVARVMDAHEIIEHPTLDQILAADKAARVAVRTALNAALPTA